MAKVSLAPIMALVTQAFSRNQKSALSEKTLRAFNRTNICIVVCSSDGYVKFWSLGATATYGWSAQEAIGKLRDDLLKTKYQSERRKILSHVKETGSWEGDIVHIAKNGQAVTVGSHWSILTGGDDSQDIVDISTNLTWQRECERRLELSEAKYRNIFQAAGVAVWEINFAHAMERILALKLGNVIALAAHFHKDPSFIREIMRLTIAVDVNDACMRMHGAISKAELLGPVDKVWAPEGEAAFAQAVLAAIGNVPSFQTDAVLLTLDGRPVEVLYSTAYPPETATRESLFVAFLDITARNAAQRQVQKLQADLAHTTRLTSLGELTASIAHEISQPLGGVLSNVQAGQRFLGKEQPDVVSALEAISAAAEEAERAGRILSNIKALAKKEGLRSERMCLNDLVKDTLPLLRRELDIAKVEIETDLDSSLAGILADRVQLQQVLINLVMNSVQAMSHADISLRRILITTAMENGHVIGSVSDTGQGVAPEVHDNLFSAFVTTRPNGMGLGLSLCASIIERHQGLIWTDRHRSLGARFSFSLPAENAMEAVE